ncbi:MAG: DUF5666 domain-containing protein [Terriglobales bacterium]
MTIALLGGVSQAHAQKSTERYIPIGQSPGLSDKYTYIGTIQAVAPEKRTITAGGRTVKITDQTRIWLDRSKLKQSNLIGNISNLQPGSRVEVKYDDPARPQAADWIKVEIASP